MSKNHPPGYGAARFRILGFIPLLLFLARLRDLIEIGQVGHILWMCHLSNLVLAAGLFMAWPPLVRISLPWLAFGLPLWVWNITRMGMVGGLTSFGTHVGGLLVGLLALFQMRCHRFQWLAALAWYLVVQQVCRMATPAELNVNIAHKAYSGYETWFAAYWQYWLVTTIAAGIFLWLIGLGLSKCFPIDP